MLPKDGTNYDFLAGDYQLQVFVEAVDEQPKKIFEQKLTLTKEEESEMLNKNAGIYFDWAPNTQNYHSHVDHRPKGDLVLSEVIEK